MPITHGKLLDLAYAYQNGGNARPKSEEDGLCFGFSTTYMNALLLGDQERFYKRLDLLGKYTDKPDKLKQDIDAVRDKLKFDEKEGKRSEYQPTEAEDMLLDVQAFFEAALLQQEGIYFNEEGKAIGRQHYLDNHEWSAPQELSGDSNKPTQLHESIHAFTKDELTQHYQSLQDILATADEKTGILITSDNHMFSIFFNHKTATLESYDANYLQYADFKNRPISSTADELADLTFRGLSDHASQHCLFQMQVIARNPNDEISAQLEALSDKQDLTTVTDRTNTRGTTTLSLATQKANIKAFQTLIHTGDNVNTPDAKNMCPLHYASTLQNPSMAQALLIHDADPNHLSHDGTTPLHTAIALRNEEVVAELIKAGANPNLVANDGCSAIMLAASKGNIKMLDSLKDVNINQADNAGSTALQVACYHGHQNMVDSLIQKKANVNQANDEGSTALFAATAGGNLKAAGALIKAGAQANHTNRHGCSALHLAVIGGHSDFIIPLCHAGADINQMLPDGNTPLSLAAEIGNNEIVETLLAAGAMNQGDAAERARNKTHDDIANRIENHFSSSKDTPAGNPPTPPAPSTAYTKKQMLKEKVIDYIKHRKSQVGHDLMKEIVEPWKTMILGEEYQRKAKTRTKEVKISAAEKLIKSLDGQRVSYNNNERAALREGRLGKLAQQEVLKSIRIPSIEIKPSSSNPSKPAR